MTWKRLVLPFRSPLRTLIVGTMLISGGAVPFWGRHANAAQEVRSESAAEKGKRLNDLAAHRVTLPPEELRRVLLAGLADSDPNIRQRALWAVAARAGAMRFGEIPGGSEKWRTERPILLALRPRIKIALMDPDERIRLGAMAALGNMEFEPGTTPKRAVTISPEVARLFREMLDRERSVGIRIELVKVFALMKRDQIRGIEADALRVVETALRDDHPDMIRYGLIGVGNQMIVESLPRVAALLEHPLSGVRMTAAGIFGLFGAAAAAHVTAIETAAAVERDEVALKTMNATIAKLRNLR